MGFWQFATGGGSGGGSGDVVGPASSTDFGVAYFDDTTGKLLASSAATITAAGSLTIPSGQTAVSPRWAMGGVTSTDAAIIESGVTAGDVAAVKGDASDYTGIRAEMYKCKGNNNPSLRQDGLRLNAGTYVQWFAADGDASSDLAIIRQGAANHIGFGGENGQFNNIKIATTTVNASGSTSTATNLVPAGCILLGVTTRVTTAITSGDGGTSVDIGNGTDADMYGNDIAFTLGTTTDLTSHTASALAFKSAAESVVFTCNGGTFSGGVWRVCAHYLDLTAPTS